MRNARLLTALIIPPLLTLAAASITAAQPITYRGIAPGAPPEQVRAWLQALGFRFRGADQDGDQVYAAGDSSELAVRFDPRGAVQFEQRWEGSTAFVRRRTRAVNDSLVRAYGRRWARGGTELTVVEQDTLTSRIRSPYLSVAVTSTAAEQAETQRSIAARDRAFAAERDEGAAGVARSASADTLAPGNSGTVGGRGRSSIGLEGGTWVAPGVYRARFHAEWWWLMRLPNGMKYSEESWEGELDCVRRTWRPARVVRYWLRQRLPAVPGSEAWTSPLTQPGAENVARASCAILQAPRAADAQLTVFGLPWGASPAAVRTAAQARGYRFRGVDQFGTHVFGGPGNAEMLAEFVPAGMMRIELRWPGPPPAARRRYTALADSLRRVLGPSRPAEGGPSRAWLGRDASLEVSYDVRSGRAQGEAVASLAATSLRLAQVNSRELERQAEAATTESQRRYAENQPIPRDTAFNRDWRLVAGNREDMVLLDLASATRLAGGIHRVRLLEEWRHPRRLENGLLYDGELRVLEIDCARRRWRLLRTLHALEEKRVEGAALESSSPTWAAPAAATWDGRVLRAACTAVARRAPSPRR
ncbi:MAG TPA: hypothetical protein VFJ82_09175 [Longimicrobium sp.]|nr:hypothetical protein [Longimicrobium sp.]